jgi:hypothetical protein
MKIHNIKEELNNDMKTSEKRMKHKHKTQWKATAADYNKQKTESHNSKIK